MLQDEDASTSQCQATEKQLIYPGLLRRADCLTSKSTLSKSTRLTNAMETLASFDHLVEVTTSIENNNKKNQQISFLRAMGSIASCSVLVRLFLRMDPEPALAFRARLVTLFRDINLEREPALEQRVGERLIFLVNELLIPIQEELACNYGPSALCHCQMATVPAWHRGGGTSSSAFDLEAVAIGVSLRQFVNMVEEILRVELGGRPTTPGFSMDLELWKRLPDRLRRLVTMPHAHGTFLLHWENAMESEAMTSALASALRAMQATASVAEPCLGLVGERKEWACSPLAQHQSVSTPRIPRVGLLSPIGNGDLHNIPLKLKFLEAWVRSLIGDFVPASIRPQVP